MRFATLVAATVIGTSTLAMAAGPTTRPSTDLASSVDNATASTSVLVLPFEQIGGIAGNYDWIGRAIQQNLVTELGRSNKMLEPLAPASAAAAPASDVKGAIDAGKSAGADAVVFGSFQILDQDLRFNGQVVDVSTGETVGTLKSTGTVRDLFAMEDTVATQAKRLLAPPPEPIYQPASLPLAIPAQPQPQQAAVTPLQQPTVSYVNDYNRYTYYPNYGYGYGYGYGYPGYAGYYPGYYWRYPASFSVYVENTGASIGRVTQPIGVGTSEGMVAKGLITVPGRFLSNGQLASK